VERHGSGGEEEWKWKEERNGWPRKGHGDPEATAQVIVIVLFFVRTDFSFAVLKQKWERESSVGGMLTGEYWKPFSGFLD